MKRLLLGCGLLGFVFYLYTMNSTENRQSLVDDQENRCYTDFARSYIEKNGNSDNGMIYRCYSVYQGLCGMRPAQGSNDPLVRQKLINMDLCELDKGELVLKGFHIEDNLSALVVSRRRLGKK